MTFTVRTDVAGMTATITSQHREPVEWVVDYFGPWWPTTDITGTGTGPVVHATIDPHRYEELERLASADHHDEVLYARSATWLAALPDGGPLAVTPAQRVAYRRDPDGGCEIIGTNTRQVSLALARIARETLRARLQADRWALVHASVSVNSNDHAILALGAKGAGKTTTALTLATTPGWSLLANDRAFVRTTTSGALELAPWPAAAALGLGLLDAYDLTPTVREHLEAGGELHPTSDAALTTAILTGDRAGLRDPAGREHKAQFHPRQLQDWLGLGLARYGTAQAVLIPQVDLAQPPARTDDDRGITDDDFFHGTTEDRYPDILGLHTTQPASCSTARSQLARLPRTGVRLGSDPSANRATLTALARQLLP